MLRSKLVRFIGITKNFNLWNATRETSIYENNLIQHRSCICNATSGFASIARPSQNLENSLKKLDQDVRKSGRISRRDIEEILEEIRTNKSATSSQSLLVIRCCGNLVPEELPEIRTALVQKIWKTLDNLNVPMDISHYNALLRVYLENEHQFSPTEFLADLQSKGVEPNRVTYQRLITRYCQQGDIDGATQILEFMREKQLPVNENVFNSLIMGHSHKDDMESATGILNVMTQAGLEISAETYTVLMCGFGRKGDIDSINNYLEVCERKDVFLLDKDLLEIVYSLATNGHSDKVDSVIEKIKRMAGYNQDAINVIFRLINKSEEDTALKILKTMPRGSRNDGELSDTGNFLIKQLVKANRPVQKILDICKDLEENKLNSRPLLIALETALTNGNLEASTALLSEMKKSGYEMRQHYWWPLICSAKNSCLDVVQTMQKDFNITPNGETIREFIIPNLQEKNYDKLLGLLRSSGLSAAASATAVIHQALVNSELEKAAEIAGNFNIFYPPGLYRRPLLQAFEKTMDYESYIKFVRALYESIPRMQTLNQKEKHEIQQENDDLVEKIESEETNDAGTNQAEILGQIVFDVASYFKVNRTEVMTKVLEGLVAQGLSISNAQADKIQDKIGEAMTTEISVLLGKLSTGELEPVPLEKNRRSSNVGQSLDIEGLEKLIHTLEEKGENTKGLKRQLLVLAIRNKDVEKTEEIMQRLEAEGYTLTSGVYAQLIDLYCAKEKVEAAVQTYQKIKIKEPSFLLDRIKVVKMAHMFVNAGDSENSLKVLEENKRDEMKEDDSGFNYRATCWRLLNSIADKGNVVELQKVFDALVANNYITPSNVLLGPLIKVHIINDDLPKAVEKFEEICQKHRATPWKNELACRLIQTEDANNLQKVTDLSTDIHGEVNSLYDLVFSFVECGRIRQARKILETPGLRTRPQRINSACERYMQEGMTQPLEGLVEATKDLSHIDRSEIYHSLLQNYIKEVDSEKALGLWMQMQEENITPSDSFLLKLAEFLKSQNITVPFSVPEVAEKPKKEKPEGAKTQQKAINKPQPVKSTTAKPANISETMSSFKEALKTGDLDRILVCKGNLLPTDKISVNDNSLIVEQLVKNDRLNDATKIVKTMLSEQTHPIPRIFRFYLNKVAAGGDISAMKEIGDKLSADTKKLLSFDNRFCHANIVAGKSGDYLKQLEIDIDNAKTTEEIKEVGEKFPRGGAVGILDSLPGSSAHFEQVAGKYAEKGLLGPMNVLWMHHFINANNMDADRLWDKYLKDAPRLMFQRVVHLAREKQDSDLVERLIKLLKTAKVSEGALGNAYSCLLDIQSTKNDFEAAMKSLENAIKDVCLENINRTALLRIKEGVEKAGNVFPYVIHNANNSKNLQSSSSSSSSSSDEEVTAKHV